MGIILAGMLARYFTQEEFGLWSILISLNGIFLSGFDFGFGNALRNRMSQLYAGGHNRESKIYFFSIFYWFIVSASALTLIFYSVGPFIPWNVLFKSTDPFIIENGASLMIIGASILSFNIAFNLYTSGFFSFQESHWNALMNGASKIALLAFSVLFVLLLQSFFAINLIAFLVTLCSSVAAFLIFLAIRKWKFMRIPLKTALGKVKELWIQSAQFAFLQIFSTVLLMADLFIISKVVGLEIVGEYFLVKRLYLVLASFHFAILLPLWSAYTEAIESKDVSWAEGLLKKTILYTIIIFVFGVTVMYFMGNQIIFLWTGKEITNTELFILLGTWGFIYGWCNCFSVFLNATGYLKKQVVFVGLAAVLFIPLSLILGEKYGIQGICYSLIIVSLPVAFSNPIETMAIIKNLKSKAI